MTNPFKTRWYRTAAVFEPLFNLFGFGLVLVRCNWTRSHCRLGLMFVGWR